jgi:hypothetical protein
MLAISMAAPPEFEREAGAIRLAPVERPIIDFFVAVPNVAAARAALVQPLEIRATRLGAKTPTPTE